MIASAKEQWAMDNKKGGSDLPPNDAIVSCYIKGTDGQLPTCPSDGSYSVGNLATWPSCSIGTNSTSGKTDDHIYIEGG
jgi:hypothetical protein